MDDFEVEPLSVTLGVHIVFQPEVILYVVHLDGASEVATLETRLENEQVFLLRHVHSEGMLGETPDGI